MGNHETCKHPPVIDPHDWEKKVSSKWNYSSEEEGPESELNGNRGPRFQPSGFPPETLASAMGRTTFQCMIFRFAFPCKCFSTGEMNDFAIVVEVFFALVGGYKIAGTRSS